jgi:hypothetical protein
VCPKYQRNRWVRGHQEDTTPLALLPIEARLNVEADHLATAAIESTKKKDRVLQVVRNPSCKVYLLNGGSPQTCKEIETLATKSNEFDLQDYYQGQPGVSNRTLNTINWAARRAAVAPMTQEEKTYSTKLLIDWLPCGAPMQRYGEHVTHCHRCKGDEPSEHIMLCPQLTKQHDEARDEFQKFLSTLKTAVPVQSALQHGYDNFLRSGTTELPQPPDESEAARDEQYQIGWDMISRGLLANEWAAIQEQATDEAEPEQRGRASGDIWATKVSRWLICDSRRYWQIRNKEREEASSPDKEPKSRALAVAQAHVIQLFGRVNKVAAEDRGIFNVSLERRLELQVQLMVEWIKTTRPIVNRMAARFRELQLCTLMSTCAPG